MTTDAPTPAPTPRTDAALFHLNLGSYEHTTACVEADFARALERELTSAQAALAAKDREIEAFKANNRYMRGHTAGYEEARSKFEPKLRTEEVLHKAARAERDQLRADNDRLYKELAWGSTHMADLRAALAAAQEALKKIANLDSYYPEEGVWSPRDCANEAIARIDAARKAQP